MSNSGPKDRKSLARKLRNKYRLVILNDDTFEEKLSLKLSRLNVFFAIGVSTILLITITTLLIAFTPLREYIPGYSSTSLRQKAVDLVTTTDSLKEQLAYNQRYLLNIRQILEGKPTIDFGDTAISDSSVQAALNTGISRAEEELRAYVENEERFDLSGENESPGFRGLSFYPPVKGLITSDYNASENHYGVDIVATQNEVIKSVQEGVVVLSEWTVETGYVIIVQHPRDFISVYKHNSALLKKQGNLVRAGEPIAIIGNSGELSSGPHLHFELWFRGNPVNPTTYLNF